MEIKQLAHFKVPGRCPSYNMSFKINYGLRQTYLTREARQFKEKVVIYSPPISVPEDRLLILEIKVVQSWIYKNKKLRKQDVQNMDKLIIDGLCKKLGIDDSFVQKSTIEKVHSPTEEYVEIKVFTLDELPGV